MRSEASRLTVTVGRRVVCKSCVITCWNPRGGSHLWLAESVLPDVRLRWPFSCLGCCCSAPGSVGFGRFVEEYWARLCAPTGTYQRVPESAQPNRQRATRQCERLMRVTGAPV